jgi:hypothetical protein
MRFQSLHLVLSLFAALAGFSNTVATTINDNFADRIHIVGTNLVVRADLAEASAEPNEPPHSRGTNSIWWS